MRPFARFFIMALFFWVPIFVIIYNVKSWNWPTAKFVGWILGAGAIAAAITAGLISLIVFFD